MFTPLLFHNHFEITHNFRLLCLLSNFQAFAKHSSDDKTHTHTYKHAHNNSDHLVVCSKKRKETIIKSYSLWREYIHYSQHRVPKENPREKLCVRRTIIVDMVVTTRHNNNNDTQHEL
jgi:hypothetical protein